MPTALALGMPGVLELIILAAFAAGIFVVVRLAVRKNQPTLPSAFPVIPMNEPDGPGSYTVRGVDRATRADKELVVQADSRANAHVKAELDGVVGTSVDKIT